MDIWTVCINLEKLAQRHIVKIAARILDGFVE